MISREPAGDGFAIEDGVYGGVAPTSYSGEGDFYDVVIVGGGAAGIGAAIGAKQAGPSSRVLIVESEGCLGGAATHRGVLSYCGLYSVSPDPQKVVGQIWDEIHSRLVKEGAASEVPDKIVALVQVSIHRQERTPVK